MLGMLRHQLAPELERIDAGFLCKLVHEAFEIDGVVVDVHTPPETRIDVRVAHRMIDENVGDRVADRRFRSAGIEPREGCGIATLLQRRRSHLGKNRLARNAHVQRSQVLVLVESGRELALGDRVIPAVDHVLLARPKELDRSARHLLGHQHRLPDVVLRGRATAESAAEERLVDLAFGDRQAACLRSGRQCLLAVLGRAPDFALVGGVARNRVLGLQRDVVLVGIVVDRLDLLGGTGQGGFHVAAFVADEGLIDVEAFLQPCGNRLARDFGVFALVPSDRKRIERGLGLPPAVGNDGDGVVLDLARPS